MTGNPDALNRYSSYWLKRKITGVIIVAVSVLVFLLFSLKKIAGTYPVAWGILTSVLIFLFAASIIVNLVNHRKKMIYELEKRQAEEELRSQNEYLRTILDALTHPFYIIDINDYSVVLANKACGFDLSTGRKPCCYQLTHNADVPCGRSNSNHECPVEIIKETGEPAIVEHIHANVDGKDRYHEIHAYPVFDKEGNLVQMIEYNLDITSRKQLESELLKSKQLESIGILAGGIAHDFNNILSVIIGNIDLVKDELSPKDKNYTFLEHAEKNAMKAADLSRKLISFSRGGWLERKKVRVPDLVRAAMGSSFLDIDFKVSLEFPDDLLPVYADERQLNQVFVNVIRNAVEAMAGVDDAFLKIEARNLDAQDKKVLTQLQPLKPDQGSFVKVSVIDRGTGIPKENIPKVFDPYFTTKTTTDQKGLGLGLTLCYSIVKKHGGLITVHSEPGTGTTVDIFLPAFNGDGS
jgi:signal transduction histidine kinase